MEPACDLVASVAQVLVPPRPHPQHRGVIIGGHLAAGPRPQRRDRHRQGVVRVALAAVPGFQHPSGSVRDGAGRIPVSGPWPGVIPLAAVPAILQSSHVGWSGPHVRPRRRVAAHPLALAGLGRALAVGQHRVAAADDEPRPSGDRPAVVDGVSRP